MAAVTPRKRSRSSSDTDGSSLAFETPVKRTIGFAEGLSPHKKSRNNWFASQMKGSSSSSDETRESEVFPVKPVLSRRLDISPLQAASVPAAAQRESAGKLSPKPAASYKPLVPVVSFYSKEKRYLTPLERKQLNENHPLGERSRDENLPAASRTEKMNGNSSRNTSSKPTKHPTNSKHGKTLPKTLKKAKGDVPPAKPSVEKENVNCLIKKKMDSPFRVLSMTVKPALKLQMGAAFFSARKKSHSKKPLVDAKSLQGLEPQEAAMQRRWTQAAPDELTSAFGSNPPAKTSHTSQKSKKAKELCKRSGDQMIIDAGQKHFGAVVCKSCGMIYTAASPEDEAQHIQHHERFLEGLRYVGWKKERVVAEFWDGKIVLILPNDPKYAVKKAEDVREIVDNELGFKQVSLSCPAKTKIYLFVSTEKMIVGCLVAESIKRAFRVLSEPGAVLSPGQDALQQQRAWRCSTEPEPAVCGISRIWVFGPRRGKGIARRMVDVVRSTFMYGCYLSTDDIAFSDPTPDGKLFATKYCQTPRFLVYNFIYSN
ncbi:PREDICTED: N-acetyltransferase ESCO2 [Charadrius vociferus]|uniref:N-acetyltransferase ESCO2 n=1 Tax=Charadrius vociferus TaxID=50402 RepID=UPI00052178DD|nr:PREDICTED: N-acetyltransferase ESCO2 [Charadrius vociferus]